MGVEWSARIRTRTTSIFPTISVKGIDHLSRNAPAATNAVTVAEMPHPTQIEDSQKACLEYAASTA
jgi:hypothetical protein